MQKCKLRIVLQNLILAFITISMFFSCKSGKVEEATPQSAVENTNELLKWFEQTGNYIHSADFPSIKDAAEVYIMREENILIIDLRSEDHYKSGHIEHAVNVTPDQVLDYFTHRIDPPAFKSIIFTCYSGMTSCYVTSIMRHLGYDNTFAMRYGMSGWDRSIAEKYWLANLRDHFEGKLEQKPNPMNKAGELPSLESVQGDGFSIAMSRAAKALDESTAAILISIDELSKGFDDYYIVCYWSDDKCSATGHLPGAVRYEPKKSLGRETFLNTLPVDQPIVVYCNSAHQSSFVTAYLRMLGYDARSLQYGANGFIYKTMTSLEPNPRRTFMESFIQNLPLVGGEDQESDQKSIGIETEKTTVQGGC
jgi:rhodanese-related sulfurtransferase